MLYMHYLKKMSLLPTCTSQPPQQTGKPRGARRLGLGFCASWSEAALAHRAACSGAGGGLANCPGLLWHPLASPRVPSLFGIVDLERKTQGVDRSDTWKCGLLVLGLQMGRRTFVSVLLGKEGLNPSHQEGEPLGLK